MARLRVALAALVVLAVAPASASAEVPYQDIASAGPLSHVWIGNELSCQVAHTADQQYELFPPSTVPGDCGTLLTAGDTLYGPDFRNHGTGSTAASGAGNTPVTPVSQTPVSGAGTSASPFSVTTVADAGPAIRVTQIDTYIAGQEAYRTDVTLQNRSGAPATGFLYRAGDCYLQGNDQGFGFVDEPNRSAGCAINANNSPAGRIEQWFSLTPGNTYFQAGFSEVWSAIAARATFANTCRCGESLDNGAGLAWSYNLQPGAQATFSHFTVFSPQGTAGPPAPVTPAPATNPPVFGPGGVISAPSNRRCLSRRNFRIRIRRLRGTTIIAATVRVNGRLVRTVRRSRITAPVDLRGLPKGRYTVRITVFTSDGRTITGTRRYRTCTPKRRAPRL